MRILSSTLRFVRRLAAMLAATGFVGQMLVSAMIVLPALTIATPAQAACTASGAFSWTINVTSYSSLPFLSNSGTGTNPTITCSGLLQTDYICASFSSVPNPHTVTRTTNPPDQLPFYIALTTGTQLFNTDSALILLQSSTLAPPGGTFSPSVALYRQSGELTMNTRAGTYTAIGGVVFSGYSAKTLDQCAGTFDPSAIGSSSFTATFVISKICHLVTTSSTLAFPTITDVGTLSANADASATILDFQCNTDTPYTLTLGDGQNRVTPGVGARRMRLGVTGNYLPYNLYTDAARSTLYPESTGLTGTGTGTTDLLPVLYGRIPAGTALTQPGAYSDAVVLTVTY